MIGRRRAVLVALASLGGCRCGAATQPSLDSSLGAVVAEAGVSKAPKPTSSGWTLPAIVVDEDGAYWFENGLELVTQKPTGEAPKSVFARAEHQPAGLALDTKRIYWLEGELGEPGALVAVGRVDGKKESLAKLTRPRGLVLDGRSALVVADDAERTSAIIRVPLDGGAPRKLASVPVGTMTLAADAASIFVIGEEVQRFPKTGGAAKKVSDSPEQAKEIVLIGSAIVFIGVDPQAMTGKVWSIPKTGAQPQPKRAEDELTMAMYAGAARLSGEDGTVVALATDGRRPFWISASNDPEVKTAALEMPGAKGKDEPTELAKVPAETGLAVFRSRIYWSTPEGVKSMPVRSP